MAKPAEKLSVSTGSTDQTVLKPYTHVRRYVTRCMDRPAWKKTIDAYSKRVEADWTVRGRRLGRHIELDDRVHEIGCLRVNVALGDVELAVAGEDADGLYGRATGLRESATTPEQAAMLLRREWGLGTRPTANMVHLLEGHGVRVFSLTEDAADVGAFCFWHGPSAFVVLNLQQSGERGRFDAAHELAHLTLHRPIDVRDKEVEREADAFASSSSCPAKRSGHPAVNGQARSSASRTSGS